MLSFLIVLSATFIFGGLVGFATAAVMAAARQAELCELWDKASRDAGRAQRELARLRARCQRECGFKWLDRRTATRRGEA